MGLAMRQMLTCNLMGSLARLYLEAKVLEVAALRLAQVGENESASRLPKLMRSDIDRLEEARHILEICSTEPPTISELAAGVGYNSVSAFAAVFKTEFGFSPSLVRGCVRDAL